jgi:hypothetical protein
MIEAILGAKWVPVSGWLFVVRFEDERVETITSVNEGYSFCLQQFHRAIERELQERHEAGDGGGVFL